MPNRIIIIKTFWITCLPFILSCRPMVITSKSVSNAPERINLPVKQYTGANDAVAEIGVTTRKGMWQQFMNAKATCEAHGYTNVRNE